MKKKELQDYRKKSAPELEKELKERGEKISKLRFGLGASNIQDIKAVKLFKKDIAQILTIIKEKDLA